MRVFFAASDGEDFGTRHRESEKAKKKEEVMTTKAIVGRRPATGDSYFRLVRAFPLASIKSEANLVEAQRVIDRLLAQGKLDEGALMYLDALSDLVAAYEDEHHAIEPASDAEMLRRLLEAKGVTQAQLSRQAGIAKSTICDVLAGRRRFSRAMIRKPAAYFRVDASILAVNL